MSYFYVTQSEQITLVLNLDGWTNFRAISNRCSRC